MKNKSFFFIFLSLIPCIIFSQITIKNLTCENLINPIGVDLPNPRLSWQLKADKRNTMQTAYEIKVSSSNPIKKKDVLWSSGKILSDQSLYVPYEGSELQSAKKYYWQVRVWNDAGKVSPWSQPAFWQMGLLQPADWKAKWIVSPDAPDSVYTPALLFRKQFSSDKRIQSATAFITAHGMYEAQINGKRIGDAYLTPGWTSYNKRLQYQTYDVTSLLNNGSNAIGVILGSGWYRTPLAWENNKNFYGSKIALLFQLQINYADGTNEIIVSDESWKTSEGAIRSSEIYDGETYDANYEKTGWSAPEYDDKNWGAVGVEDYNKNTLLATYNEPVKKHEIFKPVKIITTPKGEHVIDFGQNLVGWAQIKVNGNAGDKIIISHAEVLDKEGNFYTENLRAAKAQNIFILRGNGKNF